jgi:hypothetical protein
VPDLRHVTRNRHGSREEERRHETEALSGRPVEDLERKDRQPEELLVRLVFAHEVAGHLQGQRRREKARRIAPQRRKRLAHRGRVQVEEPLGAVAGEADAVEDALVERTAKAVGDAHGALGHRAHTAEVGGEQADDGGGLGVAVDVGGQRVRRVYGSHTDEPTRPS